MKEEFKIYRQREMKEALPYTPARGTRLMFHIPTLMEMRNDLTDENGEIKQYFKRKSQKTIKLLNLSSMSFEEAALLQH